MTSLENDIFGLFSDIYNNLIGVDSCEGDSLNDSEIASEIFYSLGHSQEYYDKAEKSNIPEIYKSSIKWLEIEFKPKLETESILVDFKKLFQEFIVRHKELLSYIHKQQDIEKDVFDLWTKSEGFTKVRCIKCGDDYGFYTSIPVENCFCATCMEEKFEGDKK